MSSKGKPPSPKVGSLRMLRSEPPPSPGPSASPVEKPSDLSPAAARVWDQLAPDLIKRGVVDPWSVVPFARLCWLTAWSAELRAQIDREGPIVAGARNGDRVRHPAWTPLRQVDTELAQLESRFGLTPADRSRIPAAMESRDPREDLLSSHYRDPSRLLS